MKKKPCVDWEKKNSSSCSFSRVPEAGMSSALEGRVG
jgi:hypothetical protein